MNWKDKIIGSCRCFTGGTNKVGLKPNNIVCDCNMNDLKFMLQSQKPISVVEIACVLIKLNKFTKNECRMIIQELTGLGTSNTISRATRKLINQGYHVFQDREKVIRAYDKENI